MTELCAAEMKAAREVIAAGGHAGDLIDCPACGGEERGGICPVCAGAGARTAGSLALDLVPRLVNHIDHLTSALREALDEWHGWTEDRVPNTDAVRIEELRRLVNVAL